MFYCDKCRNLNRWPEGMVKSNGRCELCERVGLCHDVPSSALPKSINTQEEGDWAGTTVVHPASLRKSEAATPDTVLFGQVDIDRGWPSRDYIGKCGKCECSFSGHKRQPICRVCEEDNTKAQLALAQMELSKLKGLDGDGKMALSPDAAETAKNLALIWDLTDALKGIRDLIRMDFMEEIDGEWRYVDDPDKQWLQIKTIESSCVLALNFREKMAGQAKKVEPVPSDLRAAFDDIKRRVSALEGKTSGFFDLKGD